MCSEEPQGTPFPEQPDSPHVLANSEQKGAQAWLNRTSVVSLNKSLQMLFMKY